MFIVCVEIFILSVLFDGSFNILIWEFDNGNGFMFVFDNVDYDGVNIFNLLFNILVVFVGLSFCLLVIFSCFLLVYSSVIEVISGVLFLFDFMVDLNGLIVIFFLVSMDVIFYIWNFGDGNIFFFVGVVYIYFFFGVYIVILMVINVCGIVIFE